jgi:hypothetical protein
MARKPDDVPAAGSHHKDPVTKQTDSNRKGGAAASDPHSRPPSGTAQISMTRMKIPGTPSRRTPSNLPRIRIQFRRIRPGSEPGGCRRICRDGVGNILRKTDPLFRLAEEAADGSAINVMHLIYKNKPYEGHYKDYEFSVDTMREH